MLIALKKRASSTQWNYPLSPKLFTQQFINPDDSSELIVFNASGKTLVELTLLAGYPVAEHVLDVFTTKADIEREWQQSELLRTDNAEQVMLAYRVALRAYDDQPDFPNGIRPTEAI